MCKENQESTLVNCLNKCLQNGALCQLINSNSIFTLTREMCLMLDMGCGLYPF